MHETTELVVNTGPIIAIVAALGDLRVLQMYHRVWVPWEVCQELAAGGRNQFAVAEFEMAHWLQKGTTPLQIMPVLFHLLDHGEAAVIQLALEQSIATVCIDESAGRRMARLNGLSVTGSIGVLLRAKREGHSFLMQDAIQRMRDRGVWLSDRVINFALRQAGEAPTE